jgi:hypothetical protein
VRDIEPNWEVKWGTKREHGRVVKDYCWVKVCKGLKTVMMRETEEVQSIARVLVKLETLEKKMKLRVRGVCTHEKKSGHFREFADCSG